MCSGIHTWSHRALTTMTTEKIISELEYTSQAIQTVIGLRPKCKTSLVLEMLIIIRF